MNNILEFLGKPMFKLMEEIKLIAYYPYGHGVGDVLLQQNYNYETLEHDLLQKIAEKIADKYREEFKKSIDNKSVLEFTLKGTTYFMSYKDGIRKLGTSVRNLYYEEVNRQECSDH